MPDNRELVLASTSPYRKALLQRLGLPFECASPDVDEVAFPGEPSESTALRLAQAKARAVAPRFPSALIIGSDQVATCGGERLGKPGSHDNAVAQLVAASGATVRFDTALAILDARTGVLHTRLVPTQVQFRRLTRAQIEGYLRREQPYDCAGSAKAEGLGIALIESIESSDPTALIGLPLIALTELLARMGLPVLHG